MLEDAGVRGDGALLNLGGTLVLSLGVKILLRRERADVGAGEDMVDVDRARSKRPSSMNTSSDEVSLVWLDLSWIGVLEFSNFNVYSDCWQLC